MKEVDEMKLYDAFNVCFSFCLAAFAHNLSMKAAFLDRGYDSLGGEVFVFPMVLILSCLVLEVIKRLVYHGRKKWKMA